MWILKRKKKLCKLKLFHYNYYSTQRFFFKRWKPHHTFASPYTFISSTISTSSLSLTLYCFPTYLKNGFQHSEKLFHEFLIWNWFSCIFEFSFKMKTFLPSRFASKNTFFIYLLLLKRRKKKLFCFIWRPNNRREREWRRNLIYICGAPPERDKSKNRKFNPTTHG